MPVVKQDDPKADAAAEKLRAQSASMDEAQEKKLDETVPGGQYIVNGVLVDCDGNEVGKKKKKKEDEE